MNDKEVFVAKLDGTYPLRVFELTRIAMIQEVSTMTIELPEEIWTMEDDDDREDATRDYIEELAWCDEWEIIDSGTDNVTIVDDDDEEWYSAGI